MSESKPPNRKLLALIEEAGCSYETVASNVRIVAAEAGERLYTTKSAVSSWVSGGRPRGTTPAYIAEALSRLARRKVTVAEIGLGSQTVGADAHTDPLAAAKDLGRLVMLHRRNFLAAAFATTAVGFPLGYDHDAVAATLRAARTRGRAGTAEVLTIHQLTETFRAADERLGGGHGLTTATVYLSDTVVPMLQARYPTQSVRQDAYGAAAELACLVGWKHHDLGREGAAQHYYNLAYQFALESGSPGRSAWMMRALTHQALDLSHPQHCVDLAEAALARARGTVDGKTESLLLVTAARAYSADHRSAEAACALREAEDAMTSSDEEPPSYSSASGPVAATVASHTAKTLTKMGAHPAAEQHYRAALQGRTLGIYQRVHGLTLANLARSVAAQHRHDEAIALWGRALTVMEGVASERNHKEAATIRATMGRWNRRGIPGAADLLQRAADVDRA